MRFVYHLDSIQPCDTEAAIFVSGLQEGDTFFLDPTKTKKRSLSQNDLINAMYGDISKWLKEPVIEVRRECKLRYGVPILRAYDDDFRKFYDTHIKKNLTYEEKLTAMDFLPVTSRMSVGQATEYIETVQREYAGRGVVFEDAA